MQIRIQPTVPAEYLLPQLENYRMKKKRLSLIWKRVDGGHEVHQEVKWCPPACIFCSMHFSADCTQRCGQLVNVACSTSCSTFILLV